jgi:hypothetical protein
MKEYEKIQLLADKKNTKPILNSTTELEYEFIDSKWPELNENLAHMIQDTKTGNLSKWDGELEEVRHNLTSATMCLTFHKKYWLPKSYAGFVSGSAVILNTSLSKDAKLLEEFHTIREKQHQKTQQVKKGFGGLPGFGKQQEENF